MKYSHFENGKNYSLMSRVFRLEFTERCYLNDRLQDTVICGRIQTRVSFKQMHEVPTSVKPKHETADVDGLLAFFQN